MKSMFLGKCYRHNMSSKQKQKVPTGQHNNTIEDRARRHK